MRRRALPAAAINMLALLRLRLSIERRHPVRLQNGSGPAAHLRARWPERERCADHGGMRPRVDQNATLSATDELNRVVLVVAGATVLLLLAFAGRDGYH